LFAFIHEDIIKRKDGYFYPSLSLYVFGP